MNFVTCFSLATSTFSQVKEKERKKKKRKKKRTVERHLCLILPVDLILPVFKKKREKKKELFLKSYHYLFGCRLLKLCYILNAPLC